MSDRSDLPSRLRQILDEVSADTAGEAAQSPRHWSLSDIDRLISDVAVSGTFSPEPEAEDAYGWEFEVPKKPRAEVVPESEPEYEAEQEPEPEPEFEPEPAPEPEPSPAPDEAAMINPLELTEPPPQPDHMRFDLFAGRQDTIAPVSDATRVIPAEPIEKPGVVLRRIDMQMTSDLSPVPKVVPADELRQRQSKLPDLDTVFEDIPEGQQRFADFDAEQPEPLSEEELEAQLAKSRETRANQFRSLRNLGEAMAQNGETGAEPTPLPPPEPPKSSGTPAFEYTERKRRDAVFHALRQARSRRSSAALLLAGMSAAAMVLQLSSLFSENFHGGSPGFLVSMLLFLAAAVLLTGRDMFNGCKAILRRKPNADSLLALSALFCLAQAIVSFLPGMSAGSAAMPLFLVLGSGHAAARWMQARQRCDNFRFCAYTAADSLYALRLLEEDEAPARTARQNVLRSKTVLPVPVMHPEGFIRESYRESAVDQICNWMTPLSMGLALVAGLSAGLKAASETALAGVSAGLSAAALAVTLCLPAAALLTLMQLLRGFTKSSTDKGVAILNTDAAEACARSGAVILDAQDLYLPVKGKMHGWREYWQVRTDEVLLYAAAIAIQAGGPLQAVFDGVVEGDYSVLPPVKGLAFEDRMGLTCQIHNQMVFFGNRKLLENHGVTVALSEKEERTYEHDGRRILYLAVEKRLTAFFVVSYAPDPALAETFQTLEREDAEILICNSDPVVTSETLCKAFGLRNETMTILRAAPSAACRRQMHVPAKSECAGVYHANNARAFMRAVSACLSLRASIRRLRLFQLIGSLTSVMLLLAFALTGQMDSANSLIFIAWQLIWAAITYAGTKSN